MSLKITALLLFVHQSVLANQIGVDTHTFNPSPFDGPSFSLMSPQQRIDDQKLYISSWIDYSKDTLGKYEDINPGNKSSYSDQVFMAHLTLDYEWKNFSFGLTTPYLIHHSKNPTNYDVKYTNNGLMEVRPHLSWTFKATERLSLLLYSSLNFNLLEDNFYFGKNSKPTLNGILASSYRIKKIFFNFNFGYRHRASNRDHRLSPIEVKPSHYIYGLGATFPVLSSKGIFCAIEHTASLSEFNSNEALRRDSSSSELLLGLNKKFDKWNVKSGVVVKTAGSEEVADYRLFLGLGYRFSVSNINSVRSKKRPKLVAQFIIPHIFFDFDKSKLNKNGQQEIKKIINALSHKPFVNQIIISGHTDAYGSDQYNYALGKARATTVNSYLDAYMEKTKVISLGERQPIDSAKSIYDDENRRVEVKLYE